MKDRARRFLRHYGVLPTWRSAKWTLIEDLSVWNAKVKYFKTYGTEATTKDPASQEWKKPLRYRIDDKYKPYYIHLFFTDESSRLNVWKINSIQPNKKAGQGRAANAITKDLFKKYNGVTERVAFGYCDRAELGRCIPKQLYYIDKSQLNKNIESASKADYSSHYPARLCGRLPTMKDSLRVSGTVAPSKEYPFAFYVKSGHSAEFGRYDTHKWLNSPLVLQLFGDNYNPKIKPDEDITILCRASEYKYDAVIKELYDLKSKGKEIDGLSSKIVLNAAIGFKHLKNVNNKQNRLDHVAAVALCRANELMRSKFERGRTLMIVVDSIIYKGDTKIGVDYKRLGFLHQEITGARFRMRGTNQYAFEKDGKIVAYAHSGYDDIDKIEKIEDIDNFKKSSIIKIEK